MHKRLTISLAVLGSLFIVALLSQTTLFSSRAIPPADTLEIEQLLRRLSDTNDSARQAAISEIHGRVELLPGLKYMLRTRTDPREQFLCAGAIVHVGPAAVTTIREILLDSAVDFTMRQALSWTPGTDSAAVLLLGPLVSDADSDIREWAISALNPYREGSALVGQLIVDGLSDRSASVRAASASEIIQVRDSVSRRRGAVVLVELLEDESRSVRRSAVYALGSMGDVAAPGVEGLIRRLESDPDLEIRWLAARVLGWLGPQASGAIPALLRHLNDQQPRVRLESIAALGGIGVSAIPSPMADTILTRLRECLSSDEFGVRANAINALAQIGAPALAVLDFALTSPDDSVATNAARALGSMPENPAVISPLLKAIRDHREPVRTAAAIALGGVGEPASERLRALRSDADSLVQSAAAIALRVFEVGTALGIARRCYAIEYGTWNPPLESETIEGVLPPETIRFSTEYAIRSWRPDRMEFVVQQLWGGEWYNTGYWIPDTATSSVSLDPSPSLSGVRIELNWRGPQRLVGSARTYWDYKRDVEEADVIAVEIECKRR